MRHKVMNYAETQGCNGHDTEQFGELTTSFLHTPFIHQSRLAL